MTLFVHCSLTSTAQININWNPTPTHSNGIYPPPDVTTKTYGSLAESLDTGDIVLFSGADSSGSLIKFLDRSQFSHVGLVGTAHLIVPGLILHATIIYVGEWTCPLSTTDHIVFQPLVEPEMYGGALWLGLVDWLNPVARWACALSKARPWLIEVLCPL